MATLQEDLAKTLEKYGCHCGECLTIVKASQTEFVDAMMNILRRHKYDLIQLAVGASRLPVHKFNTPSGVLEVTYEVEFDQPDWDDKAAPLKSASDYFEDDPEGKEW